jgi:hypothetical protein
MGQGSPALGTPGGRERATTKYEVVAADLRRDADAVVGVWSRNFESSTPEQHREKFAWNYLDNPAGTGRCWLLRAGPGGEVVGTAGLGFRRFLIGGQQRLVGLASDFAVDKSHRSLQPAVLLARAVLGCLGDDLPMIYGLPNRQSAGIFKRLGYRAPDVCDRRRFVKVLRVGPYLKARSGALRALTPLAPVIDLGLRAVSGYTWRRGRGRIVRELPEFDHRFDDLWQRVSPGLTLAGERTSEFLRWRYAACPFRRFRTVGLLAEGGEQLLGYAVCHVDRDRAMLISYLADRSDGRAMDDLVAGVLTWARREGLSSVVSEWPLPHLVSSLGRLGFVNRAAEYPVELLAATTPAITDADLSGWYLTPGDEDYT